MSVGGNRFIGSGVKGATFGAMGFFSAGALYLGTAATVSTLGTAAAAGFVGGLALYVPSIVLRVAMYRFELFNIQSRLLVAAVDLALLAVAMPVGAWILGLAVQPFFIAAAVAVTLYTVLNGLSLSAFHAYQAWRLTDEEILFRAFSVDDKESNFNAESVTSPIGSFC
ncbi:MAG: hypothetical protein EBY22_01915 [Gammaproteobacteria bacterium]|nr:hypothetical protein [Gammaproteobacteria bacterium]